MLVPAVALLRVRVISTVFPPNLIPGMRKLDSAAIWPLNP
jgi:hypothetical protein